MFRVHTAIIRSIRSGVAAYGLWMGGGLESRCVGRVFGADGALRHRPNCTQQLSKPSHIQKLGAENRMLQLNI